jgi:hypothetical protein
LESVGTDYAFRLFVHKPAWVKVVAMLVEETDYDNFKSQFARHQGRAGTAYERSMHEVWSVMHRLQKVGANGIRELEGCLMAKKKRPGQNRRPAAALRESERRDKAALASVIDAIAEISDCVKSRNFFGHRALQNRERWGVCSLAPRAAHLTRHARGVRHDAVGVPLLER